MTTYIELCQYFEGLPTDIPAIKTVTVGADEATIDMQSARITYPHLRVDTPEISFLNDDAADEVTQFRFRVFILKHEPKNDRREENQVLSDMLDLLKQVYRKLWTDADNNLFDLVTGPNKGDGIRHWSADNCFGWYINITINLYTATCS